MNAQLQALAAQAQLGAPVHLHLRVTFGLQCVGRVQHLLLEEPVQQVLALAQDWQRAMGSEAELQALAERATQLARSHPGSRSLDGTSHAAVSATHAVAAAIQGRALDAAAYAAYATVYSYAVSAVTDPEAFRDEHAWQVAALRELLEAGGHDLAGHRLG